MLDTFYGTTWGRGNDSAGSCGGDPADDASYSFVAPQDGWYVFRLTEYTFFDAVLYLVDACPGSEAGCDNVLDGGGPPVGGGEELYIELAAGQEIGVVVDGHAGQGGDFELSVDLFQLPECLNGNYGAVNLTLTGSTLGEGDDATASCARRDGGEDVSYGFTANGTGRYTFSLTADFDATLSLLESCPGFEIACDDVRQLGGEELTVDLEMSQQIGVLIDGWDAGLGGDYTLDIHFLPPPICWDGPLPTALPALVTGSTVGEVDEASVCNGGGSEDVTYSFTAPHDGRSSSA